jgi:hypothetical protein
MERRPPLRAGALTGLFEAASTALIGLVITAAPVLLHLISPPIAILFSFGSACLVAIYFERAAPTIILISYLFQTMFVAMASPQVAAFSDLDPMKAYNFISTVAVWLTLSARLAVGRIRLSPFVWRLLLASTGVLALAGVFFLAGLAVNPRGAAIYMRDLGLPILLFQICLVIACRTPLSMLEAVGALLAALIVCGYSELFAIDWWLTLTNGWTYWNLASLTTHDPHEAERLARETGFVAVGVKDFLTSSLFNTNLLGNLDIRVVRLQGPNFHPISFGYALAILTAFVAVQGRVFLPLAATPLLLIIGAKGALILLIFSLVFALIARVYTGTLLPLGLGLILAAYAAFAFYTGLAGGDFHVLGLIGGVNGFLSNPIGHTLGQGGNLSTNFAEIDWSKYQHMGAADVAVESAIGVLLFQMGVAGFGLLAIYLWMARTAWRLFKVWRAPALAFSASAIAIILVNGLFQEEALFAPLALGLVLSLTGLTFGALDLRTYAARAVGASNPVRPQSPSASLERKYPARPRPFAPPFGSRPVG